MLVNPKDIHKMAFKIQWGLYEFLLCHLALPMPLPKFIYMMNDLFGKYINKFVLVLLNDMLIDSTNTQNHVVHLRRLLEKLPEHQLFAKARKCKILKTSVEFLG